MQLQNRIIGLAAFAVGLLTVMAARSLAGEPEVLALKDGTIYVSPTAPPIRQGIILIEGGKIAALGKKNDLRIPRDARVIDCSGYVVTAGFWNSHVHFFERKWAEAGSIPAEELERQLQNMLTRYGFTSVFDLSSNWENTKALRGRIERAEVRGPRIRSTGEGLVTPGALPSDRILSFMGLMKTPLPEITDLDAATAETRRLLDAGIDGVKLFAPPPRGTPLPEGAAAAIADETHRHGKLIFIHPNSGADVLAALEAGVDVIGHTTPHSGEWDDAVFDAVAESRAVLTPTLSLWAYYARHDRLRIQNRIARTAIGQLRRWIDAGGRVLFGTDSGANEYDPGQEYELMAKAGMDFAGILASLTTTPAEFFGDGDQTGTIEAGRPADLVVLGGDPAIDIEALGNVRYTLRSGKIIYARPNAGR